MSRLNEIIRQPDEYRESDSKRNIKKWNNVITLFYEERIDELKQVCHHGGRGRIFAALVVDLFKMQRISYKQEPVFYGIEPDSWYVHFAEENGIKLRTHDFYNPDFVLENGTWVEITLSENTAYKKLFHHGHQADKLIVFWLDDDNGYHKEMCHSTCFPNAEVRCIENMFSQDETPESFELISRFRLLKELKCIIP